MIIPDNDFITALLNIRKEDIEACTVTCQSDTVFYHLTLSRGVSNFRRFRKRILYALNPDICYSLTEVLPTEKLPGRKRGRSLCFTEILCLFSSTLTHAPV